jgi:hypothetical protein
VNQAAPPWRSTLLSALLPLRRVRSFGLFGPGPTGWGAYASS